MTEKHVDVISEGCGESPCIMFEVLGGKRCLREQRREESDLRHIWDCPEFCSVGGKLV